MVAARLENAKLDAEEAELEARVHSLQVEFAAKQSEKAVRARSAEIHETELALARERMRQLRGTDAAPPSVTR